MTLEKFDVLEEKINQFSERYVQLKSEKENFEAVMQQKDRQISELQEKTRSLEEEKEIIKTRLDKIISNLESVSFKL